MVIVEIPPALRDYSNHRGDITVNATNVADALSQLKQSVPNVYQGVCDETGTACRHIHLFINSKFIPPRDTKALATKLKSGDVLMIRTAVSGG